MKKEIERQILHLLIGIGVIILLFYLGRRDVIAIVFSVIIIGSLFINAKILGRKIGIIEWFVSRFEREDVLVPGWGSASYATGVLIPLVFLENSAEIAAVILVLAVGDSIATIVGKMGKIKIPYNKNKTVEGSVAFFLSSLTGYYFIGLEIVGIALIAAIIESASIKIDDNLIIPIVTTIMLLVI